MKLTILSPLVSKPSGTSKFAVNTSVVCVAVKVSVASSPAVFSSVTDTELSASTSLSKVTSNGIDERNP